MIVQCAGYYRWTCWECGSTICANTVPVLTVLGNAHTSDHEADERALENVGTKHEGWDAAPHWTKCAPPPEPRLRGAFNRPTQKASSAKLDLSLEDMQFFHELGIQV